ncbi:MAG: hypothetical protein K8R58_13805 [Bacteroidales bacterium]|nr:hypothetical protein [Bacteroidales bacterium]
MNTKIIKEEIEYLIEIIEEQSNIIIKYSGKIPQIELDIILSNIRKLYENFYKLNKLNIQKLIAKAGTAQTKISDETCNDKEDVNIKVKPEEPVTEALPEKKKSSKSSGKNENTDSKEDEQVAVTPKTNKKEKHKEQVSKDSHSSKTTIDLFSDTEITIADKFKDKKTTIKDKIVEDITIAEKIQKDSINDLKSAIGINDKFIFINELFEGNMKDYNETVDKLNNFENLNNALEYFNNLKDKNSWDIKLESFKKLNEFIKCRFGQP